MKLPMFFIAAMLIAQPLAAQLQLSALDGLAAKAKESTVITLDPATLQLANGFFGPASSNAKDEKSGKLLASVRSIVLRTYEFAKEGQYDAAVVRSIREQLSAQGWSKFVDLNDGGETLELYSKSRDGKSTGFAMLAAEPKELTFIYIDGEISLADVAALGGQFGIPKLPIPNQQPNTQKDSKGKE